MTLSNAILAEQIQHIKEVANLRQVEVERRLENLNHIEERKAIEMAALAATYLPRAAQETFYEEYKGTIARLTDRVNASDKKIYTIGGGLAVIGATIQILLHYLK